MPSLTVTDLGTDFWFSIWTQFSFKWLVLLCVSTIILYFAEEQRQTVASLPLKHIKSLCGLGHIESCSLVRFLWCML